jgi:hypothetical protein
MNPKPPARAVSARRVWPVREPVSPGLGRLLSVIGSGGGAVLGWGVRALVLGGLYRLGDKLA